MIEILGVKFSPLTMQETIEKLDIHMEEGTSLFQVVTANPEMVMKANEEKEFLSLLENVDLITPDGVGIVVASKIIKQPLPERVTGYDLIHGLLQYRNDAKKKTTVYAVGAKDEVIKLAVRNLRQLYNEVEVVGYHHGYFNENGVEEQEIVKDISEKKPDLLLVGVGSPRQERFIYEHKNVLHAKVAIGCGGSFDVLAGAVKRAPVAFRKSGLEWLYRLVQEPSRWKRQLVLPKFLIRMMQTKKHS